jgi:amidase
MADDEICYAAAVDLARALRHKQLSAVEVVEAQLRQIERVNGQVNAIVTLTPERALERARFLDEQLAQGKPLGALHGLPVAHKDLFPTRGVRTTWGSPIFKDDVPDLDALIVERQTLAGAISLGKTNTPEFGAGSQTFNALFGATRNPYDLSKTCGGSSGGAAVALACGMVALADGSDMGGSLRNPASFCNVVGLRPAPGRVPSWPSKAPWSTLSVDGPLARSVGDLALLLSAIAGPDSRSPIALSDDGAGFRVALERDLRGVRVAWCPDLGGLPLDKAVRAVLDGQRATFETLGCVVEEVAPDLTGADEVFRTWRAWLFALSYGELLHTHRAQLKDTVIWNIEQGLRLSGTDLACAAVVQGQIYQRLRDFMQRYEYIVCAVSQVPPFPVEQPYVQEIDGIAMESYIDWMRSCYYISVTGHPALALPAGFTASGLPVGLQIVGRHRAELALLQLGHAYEQANPVGQRRPVLGG